MLILFVLVFRFLLFFVHLFVYMLVLVSVHVCATHLKFLKNSLLGDFH